MGDNSLFLIINDFTIYWNGVVLMLAILAGAALTVALRTMQKRNMNELLITMVVSGVCAFIGSRIYYYWNASEYFGGFSEIFRFSNGGFAVYGALLGALIGTVGTALVCKLRPGELLDVMAPGLALTIGIGRWGAAFTGENLGPAVDSMQKFPFAVFNEAEQTWMSAYFFYQSMIALAVCAVTVVLFRKKYVTKDLSCGNGDIYLLFILLYSIPQGVFELNRLDRLLFHPLFIKKLKTVPISLAFSALFSAAVLSIFILRRMSRRGINLSTLWPVAACAAGYIAYFSITMRITLPSEELEQALVIAGCILLLITGVALFALCIRESGDNAPAHGDRSGAGRSPRPVPPRPAPRPAPAPRPRGGSRNSGRNGGSANSFWD